MNDSFAIPEVPIAEAIALVNSGTPMVDVREQDEWDAGHAPGAILIPLSEFAERESDLPAEPFLIVCRSGARSLRATAHVLRGGHEAANVSGGMLDWAAAGGAVVTGTGESDGV